MIILSLVTCTAVPPLILAEWCPHVPAPMLMASLEKVDSSDSDSDFDIGKRLKSYPSSQAQISNFKSHPWKPTSHSEAHSEDENEKVINISESSGKTQLNLYLSDSQH